MAMANPDRQKEMAKKLTEGKFSIRDWREQLGSMMNMYVQVFLLETRLIVGARYPRSHR